MTRTQNLNEYAPFLTEVGCAGSTEAILHKKSLSGSPAGPNLLALIGKSR